MKPVAWIDREGDIMPMPEIPHWCPPHTMLYTADQLREVEQQRDELKETLEVAIAAAQKAEAELIECMKQRDELLAALEDLQGAFNIGDPFAARARALIDKGKP